MEVNLICVNLLTENFSLFRENLFVHYFKWSLQNYSPIFSFEKNTLCHKLHDVRMNNIEVLEPPEIPNSARFLFLMISDHIECQNATEINIGEEWPHPWPCSTTGCVEFKARHLRLAPPCYLAAPSIPGEYTYCILHKKILSFLCFSTHSQHTYKKQCAAGET